MTGFMPLCVASGIHTHVSLFHVHAVPAASVWPVPGVTMCWKTVFMEAHVAASR